MISKEDLEKKISELEERQKTFAAQAQAQLNVFQGAIQAYKDLLVEPEPTKESEE